MITIIGAIALVVLVANLVVCFRSLTRELELDQIIRNACINVVAIPTLIVGLIVFNYGSFEFVQNFEPAQTIVSLVGIK